MFMVQRISGPWPWIICKLYPKGGCFLSPAVPDHPKHIANEWFLSTIYTKRHTSKCCQCWVLQSLEQRCFNSNKGPAGDRVVSLRRRRRSAVCYRIGNSTSEMQLEGFAPKVLPTLATIAESRFEGQMMWGSKAGNHQSVDLLLEPNVAAQATVSRAHAPLQLLHISI